MKITKKIFALVLSLAVLLCAIPMTASAETAWAMVEKDGYSEDVTTLGRNAASMSALLAEGDNALAGVIPLALNADGSYLNGSGFGNTTDGIATNEFNPWGLDGVKLYFQMPDVYSVEKFGLILSNTGLRNSYEVYIGSDFDTLFDSDPVYVFDATAEGCTSSMGQYVTFNTAVSGSILGIIATDCIDTEGASVTSGARAIRLGEVYVSGTAQNAGLVENKTLHTRNIALTASENLLANATFLTAYCKGFWSGNTAFLNLANGDGTEVNVYKNSQESEWSLMWDFTFETTVEEFAMWQTNSGRRSSYKVYVGNDPATLYTEENLLYTWDARADTALNQGAYFSGTAKKTGRYMGIYFTELETHSDNAAFRIGEIFVDGVQTDSVSTVFEYGAFTTRIASSSNLIKNTDEVVEISVNSDGKYIALSGGNQSRFNDGDFTSAHGDLYSDSILIYSLGGTAKVEGFELFNRYQNYDEASYNVYASNSINGILSDDNLIYSYIAEGDVATTTNNMQYVRFANPRTAKYVAVELISSRTNNGADSNFRITEIAVYGELLEANTYEMYRNSTASVHTEDNLALNVVPESTFNGDSQRDADGNVIKDWKQGLTDGDIGGSWDTWGVSAGSKPMLFDFGTTCQIEEIIVSQRAYYTIGWEIYVSDDKATLYDAANLKGTYEISDFIVSVNGLTYEQAIKFAEDSIPTGRYLGMKIISLNSTSGSNNGSLRWTEVSVIGKKTFEVATNSASTYAVDEEVLGLSFNSSLTLPAITVNEDGTLAELTVDINGETKTIREFGTLVSRGTAATDLATVENNTVSGWKDVSYSVDEGIEQFVAVNETSIDYSVIIMPETVDEMFTARNYTACTYVMFTDGTIIYGEAFTANAAACESAELAGTPGELYDIIETEIGDINCDGEINVLDMIRFKKLLASANAADFADLLDVNKDVAANATDLVVLRNGIIGA